MPVTAAGVGNRSFAAAVDLEKTPTTPEWGGIDCRMLQYDQILGIKWKEKEGIDPIQRFRKRVKGVFFCEACALWCQLNCVLVLSFCQSFGIKVSDGLNEGVWKKEIMIYSTLLCIDNYKIVLYMRAVFSEIFPFL